MSGDPARIEQNAAMQQLFNDRATLDELSALGVLSERERKSALCEKLSRFGRNEAIQASMENLRAKDLFGTNKITLILRDPDFDVIVGEVLK